MNIIQGVQCMNIIIVVWTDNAYYSIPGKFIIMAVHCVSSGTCLRDHTRVPKAEKIACFSYPRVHAHVA